MEISRWCKHVFSVRAGCNGVARTSSLLYRGFLIRKGCDCSACSRLEVGDTAGWKPALQKSHAELFMSAAKLTLNTYRRSAASLPIGGAGINVMNTAASSHRGWDNGCPTHH